MNLFFLLASTPPHTVALDVIPFENYECSTHSIRYFKYPFLLSSTTEFNCIIINLFLFFLLESWITFVLLFVIVDLSFVRLLPSLSILD